MKNKISLIVIGFILGVVLTSGVATVFAITYGASDIAYSPSDNTWNVTTVGQAINDLALSKTSDNYSLEERIVGTWVDGKPIYQKVILDTMPSNLTEKDVNLNLQNIDKYLYLDARKIVDGNFTQNSNVGGFYFDKTDFFNVYLGTASTSTAHVRGGSSWPIRPYNFYIVVQYTKTTDQATN